MRVFAECVSVCQEVGSGIDSHNPFKKYHLHVNLTTIVFLVATVVGAVVALILRERLSAKTRENNQLLTDLGNLRVKLTEIEALKSRIDQELAATKADASARIATLTEARARLADEFQAVANRLFDDKSTKFTDHNKKEIDTLLIPLRQQLTEFRSRIETVYKTEGDDRTSLKTQIEQLRQLNSRITDEAHALTQALKGQSQVRGAWGELILENLLESAGLIKDQDFLVQETVITDDRRRLRPDIILRLPDQRHLVIDSKLSLIAYEQSVNAPTEPERDAATAAHVRAVRTHVEELSNARYEDTGKLFTPDYVLMFVPLESAFITALKADLPLYQWAFDRRVILCTAPTLLVTLKTVANLWKQDRQTKNVQEIARRGGLLYDKFASLVEDLDEIGKHLTKAQESQSEAFRKLKSGTGNLLGQVEELKTLGAKARKSLPAADVAET
jgi:DNA recombination protein RmuC